MRILSMKRLSILVLALISACAFCIFGATFTVRAEQTEVTAVAIEDANFEMVSGASVRMVVVEGENDNGLKFASKLSKADYEGIMANTNYSNIEFGVFIMPNDYVDTYGDLTEENLFGDSAIYDWATWTGSSWEYNGSKIRIINIYSNQMKEIKGDYYLEGSITNILTENIARDFVSAGYIKYTENGVVKYEMADYVEDKQANNVRSMAYVAQKQIAFEGEGCLEDEEKEWLFNYYIKKGVVNNTAKDFGYVDKSKSVENYTFNLPVDVTVLRVTTSDAEYTEIPFTYDNGVLSISKEVISAGIGAELINAGENIIYIHTVDNSGTKPVYKINEECIVVADVVLMQSDFGAKLDGTAVKAIFYPYESGYIVLGEDIDMGDCNYRIFSDTNDYLYGTLDGRGHKVTVKLSVNRGTFLAKNYGTIQNMYLDVTGTTNGYHYHAFIDENYGEVNNIIVKFNYKIAPGGNYAGTVVGHNMQGGKISNCIGEIAFANDTISGFQAGTIVGSDLTSKNVGNVTYCYGISNGLTLSHEGQGQEVVYKSQSKVCNTDTCEVFSTYLDLLGSVSSLSADNGWSKFWTYDAVNKVIKMGDFVVYSVNAQ